MHAVSIGCATAVLLTALVYYVMILRDDRFMYGDMVNWMIVIAKRGYPAMAGEYAGYPPTYLYLLGLISPLHGYFSPVVLIKIVSILFNLLGALFVAFIIKEFRKDNEISVLGGILFLLLPTVAIESALWAQADIIYLVFVLAFFLCTLKDRSLLALICLGFAFSIKMQTIFIGPYVLYLLLRGELRWRDLLAIPAVYVVAMFPAALAGRPWHDLLLIYVGQANIPYGLSAQAPNFYMFVQKFNLLSNQMGTYVGELLAVIGGLAIAYLGSRELGSSTKEKFLVVVASLLLMPFLLPKMHERYFFPADVFSYVMAFVITRSWPVAVLMQCASLLAYSVYLFHFGVGPYIGSFFTLAAIVLVYRMWKKQIDAADGVTA